jgi:hypothetical protein
MMRNKSGASLLFPRLFVDREKRLCYTFFMKISSAEETRRKSDEGNEETI